MAIGDDILQPIPAVGTSGTSYASQLVSFLQEVKARLEAPVPLTSVLVSLLDMANNAIANLRYASFYETEEEPTDPVGSLQMYGGDLWWIHEDGAAQITSGNGLNAADIGGIGGDYGGINPASFRFSDVDQTFYAYDDFAAEEWARLAARSIDVYGDIDSTTRVRITAASGTDNYTITFADALPAAQSLVQVEADGDLVYSNTLPVNTNITLSGTGKIAHGTYILIVPLEPALAADDGSGTFSGDANDPGISVLGSTDIYYPIFGLSAHHTVKGFSLVLPSAPAAAVTYTLLYATGGGTFVTTGITVTSSSTTPSAAGSFSLSAGTPLYLRMETSGAATYAVAKISYSSE